MRKGLEIAANKLANTHASLNIRKEVCELAPSCDVIQGRHTFLPILYLEFQYIAPSR